LKTEAQRETRAFPFRWFLLATICLAALAPVAEAQVTPAAGYTPPDDTPSIKVGATIFADYTFTQKPQATDADGNSIHPNSFNVSRSYINVTGNISHIVAFRVTPDIFRETNAASAGNGSLIFRIKYAFAQINLDDWMPKGSWIRLGIQQTPYLDFMEGIYRYRFQGTMFAEREGPGGSGNFISSSDAGVSFHTAFPQNYGDMHVGIYNGEFYSKAEANDQKAVQIRGTFRPAPMHPVLRGLRITGFYVADNYVANAERTRAMVAPTFEHKYVTLGLEYLSTHDQQSAVPTPKPDVHGSGWSLWVTPKFGKGFEALVRYDRMRPDVDNLLKGGNGVNKRTIAGLSYWFPHQGSVSAALLFDVENVTFSEFTTAKPTQQRVAVHSLIAF
jgi:hypothetical protein